LTDLPLFLRSETFSSFVYLGQRLARLLFLSLPPNLLLSPEIRARINRCAPVSEPPSDFFSPSFFLRSSVSHVFVDFLSVDSDPEILSSSGPISPSRSLWAFRFRRLSFSFCKSPFFQPYLPPPPRPFGGFPWGFFDPLFRSAA